MNFFLETPNHWILCEIINQAFGVVTFRLYDDARLRKGRARKGMYGLLITEA
jgi:hypothetical protein